MAGELQQDDHKVHFRIKDVWKEKNINAYNRCWLEEIKDKVIDITHKLVKEMMDCLKKLCIKFTNTEKKEQLKETEFPWNPKEDISLYFSKSHKEQEWLKNKS